MIKNLPTNAGDTGDVEKKIFFWSDLESKEPSSQPTPPPSSSSESIKICSCYNICYIPYPEAMTGRTKLSSHTHTCVHTHAHKDTGWVDWTETNQNKCLVTGSKRMIVTHLITTKAVSVFQGGPWRAKASSGRLGTYLDL